MGGWKGEAVSAFLLRTYLSVLVAGDLAQEEAGDGGKVAFVGCCGVG